MSYPYLKFLYFILIAIIFCSCFSSKSSEVLPSRYDDKANLESIISDNDEDVKSNLVEIIKFRPLNENERFAYSLNTTSPSPGLYISNTTVYAVRNNDIEDITELFTWEDVLREGIQFTDDYRICFIIQLRRQRNSPYNNLFTHYLYMANGNTGEIIKLNIDIMTGFRVSKDGKFVCFINGWRLEDFENDIFLSENEYANIFLYDIENETINQLEWRTSRPVESGWFLYRFDNIFRIYGINEGGDILAVAELDPVTVEIKVLWDKTDDDDLTEIPNVFLDNGWQDDVTFSYRNPNIRLRIDEIPL